MYSVIRTKYIYKQVGHTGAIAPKLGFSRATKPSIPLQEGAAPPRRPLDRARFRLFVLCLLRTRLLRPLFCVDLRLYILWARTILV